MRPFALSLSKPVLRTLEGGLPHASSFPPTPTVHRRSRESGNPGQGRCASIRPEPVEGPPLGVVTPAPPTRPPRIPHASLLRPPSVIPAKAGIQRGTGAGGVPHHQPPSHPQLPRHPAVGALREAPVPPERDPTSATSSTRRPAHPHRRSRESGNPGQGRGEEASPSLVIPAHPHAPLLRPLRVIPAKAGIQRGYRPFALREIEGATDDGRATLTTVQARIQYTKSHLYSLRSC